MSTSLAAPLLGSELASPGRFAAMITCASGWLVAAAVASVAVLEHYSNIAAGQVGGSKSLPSQELDLADAVAEDVLGVRGYWLLLNLVRAAGAGQLALVLASGAIPFLLDYKKELGEIKKPLLRQMFLVYSAYILTINLCFGLISTFAAESILEVGFLPSVITGFIFMYWFARLMIALFVFDLSFLNRPHEIVGRVGIELLFALLPVIYGLATLFNLGVLSLDFTIPDVGPFVRMLIVIGILFGTIKVCVFMMPKSRGQELSVFPAFLFFCVWPGMRPASFLERKSGLNWWRDIAWGTFFCIFGFVWSLCVQRAVEEDLSAELAGLLALPPISMMGHVGAFRVLRGAFRCIGYDVEQLFVDPFLASSLSDFWGSRWNIAFSDMNRYVFKAAAQTALMEDLGVGKEKAALAGVFTAFVASALLHEFAITVPVLTGYGGPSLYFMLQGCGVLLEKQPKVEGWYRRHPVIARLFVWIILAGPAPILFVPAFRTEIALPVVLFVASLPTRIVSLIM